MLNGLDLFSGIGGITMGLDGISRPIAYCERDRHAQSELMSLMRTRRLPVAPIWDDVCTLRREHLRSSVDIIYGGFPCQDISVAGAGAGLAGARSGLFFEVCRLVGELRPRFVFLENVPAITLRGLDRVLLELTALGYDSRWTIVSASSVGACHKRDRWFILAHANGKRRGKQLQPELYESETRFVPASKAWETSHSLSERREILGEFLRGKAKLPKPSCYGQWTSQPGLRGRDHGVPHRLDRLRSLGNSVVPLQARIAFEMLMGLLEMYMELAS